MKAIVSTPNEAVANDFLKIGWKYLNSVAVANLTGPTHVLGWDGGNEVPYPHPSLKPAKTNPKVTT